MTERELTMKIGQVMQRISATGDAVLAGQFAELVTELQKGTVKVDAEAAGGTAPEGKLYVVCVQATLPNGKKVNCPFVGTGYSIPDSIADYVMTTGTDLDKLKSEMQGTAQALSSMYGVKVTYPLITEAAYNTLKEKLQMLLQNVRDALVKAAEAKAAASKLMNVSIDADELTDSMLSEIVGKTLYAGSALDEEGQIVERVEGEKYSEEIAIEESRSAAADDEDDSEDDYDEDDGDGYSEEEDE